MGRQAEQSAETARRGPDYPATAERGRGGAGRGHAFLPIYPRGQQLPQVLPFTAGRAEQQGAQQHEQQSRRGPGEAGSHEEAARRSPTPGAGPKAEKHPPKK